MKVLYTEQARADLNRLGEYLVSNGFDVKLLDDILRRVERLESHPKLGRKVENNLFKVVVAKKNAVFYSVDGEIIHIRSVFAGGQNDLN